MIGKYFYIQSEIEEFNKEKNKENIIKKIKILGYDNFFFIIDRIKDGGTKINSQYYFLLPAERIKFIEKTDKNITKICKEVLK